jgi:hypothetical protein
MKKIAIAVMAVSLISGLAFAEEFKYTTPIPDGIITPNEVKTSIGTLDFTDGVPSRQTADKVYDFMDTARAADAFLRPLCAHRKNARSEQRCRRIWLSRTFYAFQGRPKRIGGMAMPLRRWRCLPSMLDFSAKTLILT